MKKQAARVLEMFWLGLAILCLLTGIYELWVSGIKNSLVFFIFALIAALMFLFRRNMRRANEQ